MSHSFPRGLSSYYIRVYQIVDDPSLDKIISWSKSNNSFIVWDFKELRIHVLSKYAQLGRNFSEFVLGLKDYGFKRVRGTGQCEFGHEDFVRGQPQLLKKMMHKALEERMVRISERMEKKRAKRRAKKDRVQVESLLQNLRI